MSNHNERCLSLVYLDRFKIKNKSEGLSEPSGLALAHEQNALWTISDDTKKVFKLNLEGDMKKGDSFDLPDKGLEGITVDPTGTCVITVKEESNEIIKIDVDTRMVIQRQGLTKMAGYDAIASYFSDAANKGLEGITWNDATGTIFVLKEGNPGLLIELSSDLETIQGYQLLNEENGFCDLDVDPEDIDFSGLCYDQCRDCLWIISDKAQRYFLYDWTKHVVVQSAKLTYSKKGRERDIEKAEGVAIAPSGDRLYVVSDEEVRLYVFEIRG